MNMLTEVEAKQLLNRVDSLILELEKIRNQIASLSSAPASINVTIPAMTELLFGAMGKGKWDEYDIFADYERFRQ